MRELVIQFRAVVGDKLRIIMIPKRRNKRRLELETIPTLFDKKTSFILIKSTLKFKVS